MLGCDGAMIAALKKKEVIKSNLGVFQSPLIALVEWVYSQLA